MFIKATKTEKLRGSTATHETLVILNTALIKFISLSSKNSTWVVYDNNIGFEVMIPYQEFLDLLTEKN
jgi:hypothetical protein